MSEQHSHRTVEELRAMIRSWATKLRNATGVYPPPPYLHQERNIEEAIIAPILDAMEVEANAV